jgi:hypothetical protein
MKLKARVQLCIVNCEQAQKGFHYWRVFGVTVVL